MATASFAVLPAALRTQERALLRLAFDLGAATFGGALSAAEAALIADADEIARTGDAALETARAAIVAGSDPLGDELIRIRPAPERRATGAFYTPSAIVEPMVAWAMERHPVRVVDAGCGSGRFAAAVARRNPAIAIIAVDLDALATLLARATLSVVGAPNARVVQGDYTALTLEPVDGRTAFIGNPPYVRHHELSAPMKAWAADAGRRLGHPVSSLSGLHAYFFLATALLARPGDIGTFITSSEWLDVGYGSVIRQLLLDGLGGLGLTAFHPRSTAFADVMTTAVIVSFEAGAHPDTMHLGQVTSAQELASPVVGRGVSRKQLEVSSRWSSLLRLPPADGDLEPIAIGTQVRLREIARVHRGQVTGGNGFFVMTRARARELGIQKWCRPAITSAREVLNADGTIRDSPERKVLLCVPKDIDRKAHPALDLYLRHGEQAIGSQPALNERYVPRHRSPWWHLGKVPAPPIVASYMARRAPAFALNPDDLALLNIGHGLWPVTDLDETELADLVAHLNKVRAGFIGEGRTYHGGLEKFEPGEMERLTIPGGERWRR